MEIIILIYSVLNVFFFVFGVLDSIWPRWGADFTLKVYMLVFPSYLLGYGLAKILTLKIGGKNE